MTLLQMSFSGGVLILAIVAVRTAAVDRLPKKGLTVLWGIAILRLLLPFSIPSVFSVYSLLGRNDAVYDTIAETPAAGLIPGIVPQTAVDGGMAGAARNGGGGAAAMSVWFIIWCVGAVLCAAFFTAAYMRCRAEFRCSLPVDNAFVEDWLKEHRLKRPAPIEIRQSDRIVAPLTYGIFHPVILMPKGTDWQDERQELQYILLHEYIHIRNFDAVKKLILVVALCVHWFNPTVWVMYILCNRDIELVCDERVVRSFGQASRAVYARMLIGMEERKSGLTPLYNHFSRNAVEERVKAIMGTRRLTAVTIAACVALVIAAGLLFTTSIKRDEENGAEGFDVPAVVLEQARQWVLAEYDYTVSRTDITEDWYYNDYTDWRVENLEYSYTYEDFEGMELEVYNFNYEFLAASPEDVQLIGGMYMTEEGWVMPWYPNSMYLIFEREGENLNYLTAMGENDCYPGDETFTADLRDSF